MQISVSRLAPNKSVGPQAYNSHRYGNMNCAGFGKRAGMTSGTSTNEYIFFAGGRIARRDGSGNVDYYMGDHLGSWRSITTATGTLCYDADFYPFGGELNFLNTCGQNYKFAGMERDSESGLDHTLFRQYTPNQGRWLSPDPLGGDVLNPQSLNRYAYVLNDPIDAIDPLGLGNAWTLHGDWLPGEPVILSANALGALGMGGNGRIIYTLNGAVTSPGIVGDFLQSGVAAQCPNNDCTGLRLTWDNQFQRWVIEAASTKIGGTEYPLSATGGHWETVGTVRSDREIAIGILPWGFGGLGTAAALGGAGEAAVGAARNFQRINSVTGATYRVPDILDRVNSIIGEIKNVKYLSYTKQLRDYVAFAQENGYRFMLYVRQGAKLSVPLKNALNQIGSVPKFF